MPRKCVCFDTSSGPADHLPLKGKACIVIHFLLFHRVFWSVVTGWRQVAAPTGYMTIGRNKTSSAVILSGAKRSEGSQIHNEILRRLEPPQNDKRGNGGHRMRCRGGDPPPANGGYGMLQRWASFDTSSASYLGTFPSKGKACVIGHFSLFHLCFWVISLPPRLSS